MKMTFYAVFDTNVLVSALMTRRADSPTVALLDYVLDRRIVLLYNDDILSEYDEVALAKDGSYVVTGNLKHFPRTPIVVTPAEMLRMLTTD